MEPPTRCGASEQGGDGSRAISLSASAQRGEDLVDITSIVYS